MALKTAAWLLLISWIAASSYWHTCKIQGLCGPPAFATQPITSTDLLEDFQPPVLVVSDNAGFSLKFSDNFHFAKSGSEPDIRKIRTHIDSLTTYLKTKPSNIVKITGSYAADEKNETNFPDLGIARANNVKAIFLNEGLADSIFTLESKVDDLLNFPYDSLTGGITFSIGHPADGEDLAGSQKFETIFKPMDLYFQAASAQYITTAQNQMFLSTAKKYLELHKDKKLILIGHTDDEDSSEWNLILSKKRALAVSRQFEHAGIDPERMTILGKGESQPKAPNNSPEGKKINRRVTIVVQ